jgi:predicted molibdopterin-dependent oxidoreductase YjgC
MTILIDGSAFEPEGSLLDAILAAAIDLPHLCKDDNLPAIGACRTCLVEADGRVVASCSLPASSVREVSTTSERVRRLRRGVLELTAGMLSESSKAGGPLSHTADEAFEREGVDRARFSGRTRTAADASNSFFAFAEGACILCGRCTTACQELQHISAIGLAGRGSGTLVTPGAAQTFRESVCTSCGSCVAACPTSALSPKPGGIA